jgi:hypothetical protein
LSVPGKVGHGDAAVERLRRLGSSANALTDVLLAGEGEGQAEALGLAAAHHAELLGCSAESVVAATHSARVRLRQWVQAMGLRVVKESAGRRLLAAASAREDRAPALAPLTATLALPRRDSPEALRLTQLEQGLNAVRGSKDTRVLRLNELLHLVLDTMQRALELRCVVLCLREPRGGRLTGRVGLGPGASEASAAFSIVPDATASHDLFAVLCAKGADLLVAHAATVAARLPAWYRQRVNAPTFLLLPLMHQGAAIGLIYGDKAVAGTLVLADAELVLLRALRDQAVAAFRRA